MADTFFRLAQEAEETQGQQQKQLPELKKEAAE
jgi:hypothetical protein